MTQIRQQRSSCFARKRGNFGDHLTSGLCGEFRAGARANREFCYQPAFRFCFKVEPDLRAGRVWAHGEVEGGRFCVRNAESGDKSPHSKIAPARTRFGVRRFIAALRAPAPSVTAVPLPAALGVQFTEVELQNRRSRTILRWRGDAGLEPRPAWRSGPTGATAPFQTLTVIAKHGRRDDGRYLGELPIKGNIDSELIGENHSCARRHGRAIGRPVFLL